METAFAINELNSLTVPNGIHKGMPFQSCIINISMHSFIQITWSDSQPWAKPCSRPWSRPGEQDRQAHSAIPRRPLCARPPWRWSWVQRGRSSWSFRVWALMLPQGPSHNSESDRVGSSVKALYIKDKQTPRQSFSLYPRKNKAQGYSHLKSWNHSTEVQWLYVPPNYLWP